MTGRSGRSFFISPSSSGPSMPGMLMSERTASSVGSISPPADPTPVPRRGIMQDIRALTGLKTKPLPKELRHVGLVVHDQDAETHNVVPVAVAYWERGRRIVNSVNSPSWLST